MSAAQLPSTAYGTSTSAGVSLQPYTALSGCQWLPVARVPWSYLPRLVGSHAIARASDQSDGVRPPLQILPVHITVVHVRRWVMPAGQPRKD